MRACVCVRAVGLYHDCRVVGVGVAGVAGVGGWGPDFISDLQPSGSSGQLLPAAERSRSACSASWDLREEVIAAAAAAAVAAAAARVAPST